jgi:MFS family permease
VHPDTDAKIEEPQSRLLPSGDRAVVSSSSLAGQRSRAERLPAPLRHRLRRLRNEVFLENVLRNWVWDMAAGISSGIYQGCIWTFALQLARGRLHATGYEMGAATAAPAVGYLFATIWARQMEGRSKLPFVTLTWLISRGLFLFTPLLVRGPASREMFVALLCLTPIIFSVSTPAYTAIMKEIYPDEHRGRLMSYVRIGMAASMLITARVMGAWQQNGGLDFRWMFAIGGVFGAGTAYCFSRLRLPPVTRTELPPLRRFLRETFSIIVTNRGYRWFTVSVFIAGFGNLCATTYYPLYQVDRFHITPVQIANMQNVGGLMAMFSLFFWGWYMDRFGSLATVLLAVFLNSLTPIFYIVGPTVAWLYLAAAAAGIGGYGIDLGYLNTTLMFAERGRAAQYQAVHSSFFGLRGTIAPLLAIPLLHAVHHSWVTAFLICLVIMLVGVVFQIFSLLTYRSIQRSVSG